MSAGRFAARRLLLLGLVGLAVWVVWWSPLFALRGEAVTVLTDGDRVGSSIVEDAVEPFVGTSLTRLDLAGIETAVEGVPWVWEASVRRDWPHGLTVEIVERVGVAVIADPDLGYVLVDVEGVELERFETAPEELPVLTVPLGAGNARILVAALTVASALPPDLAARVEAVRAETEDSVTLFLEDGPRVEWGSPEESELKVEVLEVLLSSEAASSAIIDVSAPTFPVTSG